MFRSSVWGIPVRLPLAYLYLQQAGSRQLIMSPLASVTVKGSPQEFEIEFRRIGMESISLRARGCDYGDLGDDIVNTLVGDLEIREANRLIAQARGTAALERRAPSDP